MLSSAPLQTWRSPKSSILEPSSRPRRLLPLPIHKSPIPTAAAAAVSTASSSTLSSRGGGGCLRSIAKKKKTHWVTSLSPRASVAGAEYTVEPGTEVKFQKDQSVLGCSGMLSLLGTGYREKVFAIIGIKVYAAGFYADLSITERLNDWKGKSAAEILDDLSLFTSIFRDSTAKSLQIVLVRDIDGETFWNALNDVISPRIKEPSAIDDSALSTFRNTFQGHPLTQGTSIFLTWVEPSKMLVSISTDGFPSTVNAVIESMNVTLALFDAYFGDSPVSPTLKTSVAGGLALALQ